MYKQEISIEILNNRIFLDQNCWNCHIWEDKSGCEYCKGSGFLPTVVGGQILAFIKRHSKLEE